MNIETNQQLITTADFTKKLILTLLTAMLIPCSIKAGPIIVSEHTSLVTVTLENLNMDIDDLNLAIGAVSNEGAVLGYNSQSVNDHQIVQDSYIRYEDQFGANVGSYAAIIDQSGNSDGFSYASNITSVNAAGQRSPLVGMVSEVNTTFHVTEDTKARVNVALQGNTFAGRNFVGLQIDGDGENGEFERLYYAPSRFGLADGVSGTDSLEVTLKQGFTYQLAGQSMATTLFSSPHDGQAPPSSLAYSLLTTQSLQGNSQENSLKPAASNYSGVFGTSFGHQFLLDSDEVLEWGDSAIWLDPEVAVGYDYLVDGAGLIGIDLPEFSLFNNLTYQLFDLSGNFLADLLAGDSFDFSSIVSGFRLLGIDPNLGLDPFSPGFTLGLRFGTPDKSTVLISQLPITTNVTVNSVPVAKVFWIFLSTVAMMLWMRSCRSRCS
ncbi:hypothetical protein [uncultured Paraglaciecola sp.]|uniref:hypothetical protein n=1 Tax=uncultured Paraglaciecola sp. TaxID=1765024 RepID=UPI0030D6D008|tara:strand:+ start:32975 stop:34279 length:1305 start_codon:yes stop_codon:yes gene_type:complete